MKRLKNHRIAVLVTLLLVVGVAYPVSVALAGGRPDTTVRIVEPPSLEDDPTPPPAPPEKAAAAAAAQDLPRDSVAPEPHRHDDEVAAAGAPGLNVANDPDVWVCVTPDGLALMRMIHLPPPALLMAARDDVAAKRAKDPQYMPVLEYEAAPEGCQPLPGMPSLEDFHRARSPLAVLNADGTIKSAAQIWDEAEGAGR